MVDPIFGAMSSFDIALVILLNQAIFVVLFIAIWLTRTGYPRWIPRKLVHISIATAIALVTPFFSNITGIVFTTILFMIWLSLSVLAGLKFRTELLDAGRRENERLIDTFLSPFVVVVSFSVLLFISSYRSEIFASGVLALGWGDGAGEIVGRLWGQHHYQKFCREKTIEGTVSVVLATMCGIIAPFSFYNPLIVTPIFWVLILIIATIIGIVEMFCVGWLDNLVLPTLTGLLLLVFGL